MFKVDMHTHTVASGHAFSTIQEMAVGAKNNNIELLGITDHGPAVPGSATETYFMCGDRFPRVINGVQILFGVEANIINAAGEIDLSQKTINKLDYVMAGLHYGCGYIDKGEEENTKAMINAMKNPAVKIITHPYSSMIKVNIEEVVKASIEQNVLLEINASFFYNGKADDVEVNKKIKTMINILKSNNRKMLINSDAHSSFEVGRFEKLVERFAEFNLTDEDILNGSKEEVLKFLCRKN